MKLQRKHRGEDAARNCAAAKNHGGQIWQAKLRRGSGVEVISLNKHKEDGSHNNREVQAGGGHMRTGGSQALIMLTQGSSHSRVNWETSTICVTTIEVGRLAWWPGPRVLLSQMYQSVLSPDLLKTDRGGGQWDAEERSECGWRVRTMYRFKDKLVTVWISLGSSQCSEISSSHVSGYTVHEWAISWSSIRPAHLNWAFVHQERAISSCFALSSGSSLQRQRASRMCWALNRMSCIL